MNLQAVGGFIHPLLLVSTVDLKASYERWQLGAVTFLNLFIVQIYLTPEVGVLQLPYMWDKYIVKKYRKLQI
ncbi:hypothetical protein J32TS6_29890 [Virgibacillus pantothenticus]|uniref:hypothetical protein n=1 Tax=Virgibacillus pantothenticus TaxID=1473 RepID=UPI0009099655|nr:hypothetical protein [Virgibacillus pantothenticus]API90906.1 hypothetical protein BKP57_02970 [Virgibacillus sp. 6R]MBU8648643.1 hypothetical protein [Virgibacillus pantothenticus]GIP64434.1 hypothetical protein J32TS6_29890 [Virgibacillus pantothenticus]